MSVYGAISLDGLLSNISAVVIATAALVLGTYLYDTYVRTPLPVTVVNPPRVTNQPADESPRATAPPAGANQATAGSPDATPDGDNTIRNKPLFSCNESASSNGTTRGRDLERAYCDATGCSDPATPSSGEALFLQEWIILAVAATHACNPRDQQALSADVVMSRILQLKLPNERYACTASQLALIDRIDDTAKQLQELGSSCAGSENPKLSQRVNAFLKRYNVRFD